MAINWQEVNQVLFPLKGYEDAASASRNPLVIHLSGRTLISHCPRYPAIHTWASAATRKNAMSNTQQHCFKPWKSCSSPAYCASAI
jgi:hypothetical protein